MDEIEASVYEEINPYDDMDIDIENDDRLEKELITW